MKKLVLLLILLLIFPNVVFATKGCCSNHGGVVGCSPSGKKICGDGTYSPTCTCEPVYIYGCTDSNSINYNKSANKDDGSCIKKIQGCMDSTAINNNNNANIDDYSCKYSEEKIEHEVIEYKTVNKYNNKLSENKKNTLQEGKCGEKYVTYEIIKDSKGNIISKNIIKEEIISEPIDEIIEIGTKKQFPVVSILWVLCSIFLPIYNSYIKKAEGTLFYKILQKEGKVKIILLILYFISVIMVFIDLGILIFRKIKNV